MNRYLVDTNILSEPLKPKPNDRVIALMKQHSEQIVISTIIWHEILFGFYRLPSSRRKETIERYIRSVKATFPILPYTIESADWQALERARLSKIGQSPSFPDSQIAAIAAVNDLMLVTNNVSDYQNFQGVLIENWFTVRQ